MKKIAKYNLFKGISTVLTVGAPIVTLASVSDLFIHRPDTAISAAGVFAILISLLFFKDKIAENFKIPSPFVICVITLILIVMIESIIQPIKIVCIVTLISTGIDTLLFKNIYKHIESSLPESVQSHKYFGFIFGKTDKLIGEEK